MPTFRLYPNSDDGPNTFTMAFPHWARLDEDVESPTLANFIRATVPGLSDRHGFTSVPTGLTQCQQIIVRVVHEMANGGSMSGDMVFGMLVYSGDTVVGAAAVPIANNSGVVTDMFLVPVALNKTEMEAIRVQWNSTSTLPDDWFGIGPRYQIYAVNVDITYTETEKVLASETSNEKVISTSTSTGIVFGPLTSFAAANGTWVAFNTTENFSLGGTLEYKEILCKGHTLRMRQRGPIKRVQIYIGDLADFTLHSLYVKMWTRRLDGLYDLTASTENLRGSLVTNSVNTIDFAEIDGSLEGDYYSVVLYGFKTGAGDLLASSAGTTKSRGYVVSSAPSETGFNWEAQPNFGIGNNFIEVRLATNGPQVSFIGDSWTSGANTHNSFITNLSESVDVALTRLEDIFPYWFSQYSGHTHTQNMGLGGETSTEVKNRFAVDVIAKSPQAVVLQCPGRNDVVAAVPQATSLSNLDDMLDQCDAVDTPCAILMPGPWDAGTNNENLTLDALISACRATIAAHPGRNFVVDIRDDIATARVGGTPGNLWDFATGMDAGDGLHPSPLAYQVIGREIAKTIADEKLVIA